VEFKGGACCQVSFFTKFVTEAVDLARSDSTAGLKRLKTLIKQACGGEKKDTNFKQKICPDQIGWIDRV
jgi:hypothetical protein